MSTLKKKIKYESKQRNFKKGYSHINETLKLKEKYEIVEKLSKKHSKRKLLRILEVSRSSYYYNQKEKKNQREIENEILLEQITLIC